MRYWIIISIKEFFEAAAIVVVVAAAESMTVLKK
jgi:hypothetical protein